jgi:hypothetical protein
MAVSNSANASDRPLLAAATVQLFGLAGSPFWQLVVMNKEKVKDRSRRMFFMTKGILAFPFMSATTQLVTFC